MPTVTVPGLNLAPDGTDAGAATPETWHLTSDLGFISIRVRTGEVPGPEETSVKVNQGAALGS